MINSNNTPDLNLNHADVAKTLRHKLVSSAHLPSAQATMAHQNNSIFLSICSNETNQLNQNSGIIISEQFMPHTKDKKSFEIVVNSKERVKVQHLQTHSKLQNNRWNCHSFCNIGADRKNDLPNINNNNNIINQNESAFNEMRINTQQSETVSAQSGSSNLEYVMNTVMKEQAGGDKNTDTEKRTSPACRTEDQESAFRRIEDVHNYSKLNRYSYSNASSNSSLHEDDDVEEEDGEDDDEELDDEVLEDSFKTYSFLNKKQQSSRNITHHETCFSGLRKPDRTAYPLDADMAKHDADGDDGSQVPARPDHHARRPMNAFLIFCKRHRAIVKDKYKSFENRAITKILGDWWASLEANEKKCYTNLAQQNKDAFFNANPNFKWYKLPAPPLRTLHTRPSNAERLTDHVDHVLETAPINTHRSGDHIFKFADEAQMGDLSTLMCAKKESRQNALQQALGETTQYLSIQIPDMDPSNNKWPGLEMSYKRRLQNDNSFSSNSSEEDQLPKKNSRSCKGKIYQELINSGQIAAITKKTKVPKVSLQQINDQHRNFSNDAVASTPAHPWSYRSEDHFWSNDSMVQNRCTDSAGMFDNKSKINESGSDDLIHFDLEEKIKQLPALSLETYLQRKRNTKKKKKINSKKRNSSSSSKSQFTERATPTIISPPITPPKDISQPFQAVGSQKRKARKESITRRDISAIENEVASLLPLKEDFGAITCSGRYYYNDSQIPETAQRTNTLPGAHQSIGISIEPKPAVDQFSNFVTNINHNISSTSDLLILAEVAAKRTEISN